MTEKNGLYYMRARYYNPEIKRFMSEDILQGNILDSPSMNRYAYVNGNPISQIDPYGLSAESDSGMKKVHKVLDVIGLMPVLGDAVDGANGIIYLLEGDKGNAVLSGISVIPIIGDGIGKGIKWGREGVEVGEKLLIKNADKADEIRDGLKLDLQLFGIKGVGDVIEGTVKALDDIPMSRLDYHFNKHKEEFMDLYGNLSKDGYLNKAREFVTQEASDSVEMFYRGNGDKVIFNKTTQEFGVQTKDGLIKTYFIPDPSAHGYKTNYDYFKAQ